MFFYVLQQKTYSIEKFFFLQVLQFLWMWLNSLEISIFTPRWCSLTWRICWQQLIKDVPFFTRRLLRRADIRCARPSPMLRNARSLSKQRVRAPYWRSWWTWGFPSLALKQLIFHDAWSTHTVLMPLMSCLAVSLPSISFVYKLMLYK